MDQEKNSRGFIKYIAVILVILIVVFLSQQPFMRPFGLLAYNWSAEKINSYWSKTSNWFWAGLYPNVQEEAVEKGGTLKEEVITQKDNAAKSIWEKIKNYFAEKFYNISGTKVE